MVSPWILCSKEKKYKNKELSEITGKRPIGLNGINNLATAGDFLSRVFAPLLVEPTNPKDYETTLSQFQEQKAEVFGYLCGLTSKFLYYYNELKDKITPQTRLDFEVVGEVISRCLGNNPEDFQKAWIQNRVDQTETTITSSTLAKILLIYIEAAKESDFCTTPEQLFVHLKNLAAMNGFDIAKDPTFPKNAVWMTRNLNRLVGSFRTKNIKIETGGKDQSGQRSIHISKAPSPTSKTA